MNRQTEMLTVPCRCGRHNEFTRYVRTENPESDEYNNQSPSRSRKNFAVGNGESSNNACGYHDQTSRFTSHNMQNNESDFDFEETIAEVDLPTSMGQNVMIKASDLLNYEPKSEFLRKLKQQLLQSKELNLSSLENTTNDYDFEGSRTIHESTEVSPSRDYNDNYSSKRLMNHSCTCVNHHSRGDKKSEHVSRNKKRVTCGRRKRKCASVERCESGDAFQPTLKRPYENSCPRCWRYASPARSPVNKPEQKFDPNFRRAHSCAALASEEEDLNVQDDSISPCRQTKSFIGEQNNEVSPRTMHGYQTERNSPPRHRSDCPVVQFSQPSNPTPRSPDLQISTAKTTQNACARCASPPKTVRESSPSQYASPPRTMQGPTQCYSPTGPKQDRSTHYSPSRSLFEQTEYYSPPGPKQNRSAHYSPSRSLFEQTEYYSPPGPKQNRTVAHFSPTKTYDDSQYFLPPGATEKRYSPPSSTMQGLSSRCSQPVGTSAQHGVTSMSPSRQGMSKPPQNMADLPQSYGNATHVVTPRGAQTIHNMSCPKHGLVQMESGQRPKPQSFIPGSQTEMNRSFSPVNQRNASRKYVPEAPDECFQPCSSQHGYEDDLDVTEYKTFVATKPSPTREQAYTAGGGFSQSRDGMMSPPVEECSYSNRDSREDLECVEENEPPTSFEKEKGKSSNEFSKVKSVTKSPSSKSPKKNSPSGSRQEVSFANHSKSSARHSKKGKQKSPSSKCGSCKVRCARSPKKCSRKDTSPNSSKGGENRQPCPPASSPSKQNKQPCSPCSPRCGPQEGSPSKQNKQPCSPRSPRCAPQEVSRVKQNKQCSSQERPQTASSLVQKTPCSSQGRPQTANQSNACPPQERPQTATSSSNQRDSPKSKVSVKVPKVYFDSGHRVNDCTCYPRIPFSDTNPDGETEKLCCHCQWDKKEPDDCNVPTQAFDGIKFPCPYSRIAYNSKDLTDQSGSEYRLPGPVLRERPPSDSSADLSHSRFLRELAELGKATRIPPCAPKKYAVFYMTQCKETKGDNVEVLVEELSQSCPNNTDGRTKDITEKMKKIMENPTDSMALRFQKGVTESRTPHSSRILYF